MRWAFFLQVIIPALVGNSLLKVVPAQSMSNPMTRDPNKIRIGGLVIDMGNKFIQHSMAAMTTYTPYSTPGAQPLYTRRTIDKGRHFIVFPDNKYPRGSGHYIVMRKFKVPGMRKPLRNIIYEAFDMFLEHSTRAIIFNWPHEGAGSGGRAKPYDEPDKDEEGKVDVGEVVGRGKRRAEDDEIQIPPFSFIKISFSPGEQKAPEDLDYDGLPAPSGLDLELPNKTNGEANLDANAVNNFTSIYDYKEPGLNYDTSRDPPLQQFFGDNSSGYSIEPEE